MTALAMFGFAVNDAFDFHKDSAAGVKRPVASGALSRKNALWLAAYLLLAAFLLGSFVFTGALALAVTAVLLALYSPVASRLPLCKNMLVALICCSPLYYGAAAGDRSSPWRAYALLACFVLGREVFMDADELLGDARAGMRTWAVMLGRKVASRLGAGLMIFAASALLMLVRGTVAITAAAAALASLIALLAWPRLAVSRKVELSRISMLMGSVALACANSWLG
jgi:4-hydroxybenzoate polyprenyltransferase